MSPGVPLPPESFLESDTNQKSFGSNATIYAKSKNTNESDVKKFLEFADRNPNISSSELQSYFKHRIREEN